MLEGGILTFFKDSKHSAAGALVSAMGPQEGQHPSGEGENPWDGVRSHGVGPGLVGWGQDAKDKNGTQQERAGTHGMGSGAMR